MEKTFRIAFEFLNTMSAAEVIRLTIVFDGSCCSRWIDSHVTHGIDDYWFGLHVVAVDLDHGS